MEWKEVRLESILALPSRNGLTKPSKIRGKGVKMIGMGELFANPIIYDIPMDRVPVTDKELFNSRIMPGDLLFARQSLTLEGAGKCCYVKEVKEETVFESHLIRIRIDKTKADAEFIYYFFNSFIGKCLIQNLVTQVAAAGIRGSELVKLEITIPKELEDQRRIASILSSLDRKIELNNKINADLEEMAQAIFKNWLSGCSDDVTIGELSLNITNYEKTDAEEVVLINSSDVTEGYFDHHNYSPNKNLKGHFKKRFQKGDILYSQVRPRNRHWAYCNFDANDYLASTQLMVIRNNPSLITSILLYQYIISDNVWKEFTLKTETRSGTFPQGNYEDLSHIRVPYNSDVEGISNQLETLYAKMFMLEKESSRLSLLRDTLLPRLMSGEIEVPQ